MNREGGKEEELREQKKHSLLKPYEDLSYEDYDYMLYGRRDFEEAMDQRETCSSIIYEDSLEDEEKELIKGLLKKYVLKYIKR